MIRLRIPQLIRSIVSQIYCSKGGVLIGRGTGAGAAEELTLGTGLSITGGVLNADGVTSYNDLADVPATFAPVIGAGAGDAVAGNDSRLTDSRTPVAHSHTASELTLALQGTTADPERIGAEYMPEVLNPDWITLEDMNGVPDIPEFAIHRKGDIPYIGDKPIGGGFNSVLHPTYTSPTEANLVSFPLSAEQVADGKFFFVTFRMVVKSFGTVGLFQAMINLDLGNGIGGLLSGTYVDIGFDVHVDLEVFMLMQLQNLGGNLCLVPSLTHGGVKAFHCATGVDAAMSIKFGDGSASNLVGDLGSAAVGNSPGAANTIAANLWFDPASTVSAVSILVRDFKVEEYIP